MLTTKNQHFNADLLEEIPSFQQKVEKKFYHAYEKAVVIASAETGINKNEFPTRCPFILAECLDFSFLPQ